MKATKIFSTAIVTLIAFLFVLASGADAQQVIYEDQATASLRRLPIILVDDTDGKSPETGITFSAGDIKCSKNGAAEGNHAGTVTEIGEGKYYYELTSGEADTPGFFACSFIKSGVRTVYAWAQILTHPFNDPAPASPVTDSAWDSLKALTGPDGTAQGAGAGGGVLTDIDLATGASSVDDYYNDNTTVAIIGGTGAGQNRCVIDYVGSSRRATLLSAWTTDVDNTSEYVLIATPNCNGAATSVSIAAGGITTSSFASGAINAAAIATDAIGSAEIAADAIGAAEIATDAITATEIAADAIGAAEIADNAVDAGAIASSAITSAKFGSGAVNAAAVNADIKGASYNSSTDTLEQIRDNLGLNVTLANDAISAAKIADDGANKLADHVLRRNSADLEESADGDPLDFQSLYGAVAKQTNNISVSGSTLIIKKADGATTFDEQAVSTSAGAAPVTGLATN